MKRTCTDDFEVNFFIVNHACMTEGHRHGRMCFCEQDECNGGPTAAAAPSSAMAVVSVAAATVFLTQCRNFCSSILFGGQPLAKTRRRKVLC